MTGERSRSGHEPVATPSLLACASEFSTSVPTPSTSSWSTPTVAAIPRP
ncbi:hypothetical protein ACFPM0_20090 [Pseudonocardia sulfidoxydans]